MRRPLLLLAPALLFGCAHSPIISSERVVQLPPESRQQIVRAEQGVDMARQNVSAARVGLDEARSFHHAASSELDAASTHAALRSPEVYTRELSSARSKRDYADRLIELRRAELDERNAELNLARADFEYAKFAQLQDHQLAGDLDQRDFERARQHAQQAVADQNNRVASLRGDVESLRTTWMERAADFQTASRGAEVIAPTPPEPLDYPMPTERMAEPPTFNSSPRGDVNGTPSAPMSIPQD